MLNRPRPTQGCRVDIIIIIIIIIICVRNVSCSISMSSLTSYFKYTTGRKNYYISVRNLKIKKIVTEVCRKLFNEELRSLYRLQDFVLLNKRRTRWRKIRTDRYELRIPNSNRKNRKGKEHWKEQDLDRKMILNWKIEM